MSACTALFALGDRRVAHKNSKFMFHAVGIKKAKQYKKKFKKLYADRWLKVIRSVDAPLATYLHEKGWLLTKRKDWVVRARSLKSKFGNYITVLY